MNRDRPPRKNRGINLVLWGAVVVVCGYVLLPAAVELVQTRQQESREQLAAEELERDLRAAQERLDLFGKDPDAARKKAELLDLKARRENLQEETHD